VDAAYERQLKEAEERLKDEYRSKLQKQEQRLAKVKGSVFAGHRKPRPPPSAALSEQDSKPKAAHLCEAEFVLDEYHSDDDDEEGQSARKRARLALLDDSDSDNSDSEGFQDAEDIDVLKVIYTSRTHSQLNQFVHEVQQTVFANHSNEKQGYRHTKIVALASRQRLCIHPAVAGLRSVDKINDKCLDLQKKKGGLSSDQ
jgi:chromosome transmission fidelity protein 1